MARRQDAAPRMQRLALMASRGTRRYKRNRAAILNGTPTCWICGKPIDTSLAYWITKPDGSRTINPLAGTADHVEAFAKGGSDHRTNLKPAHAGCNRAKSDKPHAPIVRRSGALD